MALVPLPAIDGDPRITRNDYKSQGKIAAKEVIKSLIKLRCPPEMGTMVKVCYENTVVKNRYPNRFILDGQRIMVLIEDYHAALRAQPQYLQVKQIFLRNVNIHGLMADEDKKKFQNLLMTFFLPLSSDNNPPHDDRIMMAISITVEVAIEILLSSGNACDVEKLTKWTQDVLNPRRNFAFTVDQWLFVRWLHIYTQLTDRTRQFNLTQPGVLALDQTSLDAAMNAALPPTVPETSHLATQQKKNLKTVLCPNPVDAKTYASTVGPSAGNRFKVGDQEDVIHDILMSFVASRITPTAKDPNRKQTFLQTLTFKRQDFSQKPMGLTMTAYGELVSQTETYKKILKAIKDKSKGNRHIYQTLLPLYILPPDGPIIYDRIMTVCLLASDFVNELFHSPADLLPVHIINDSASAMKANYQMTKVVQEGLFRLPHFFPEIRRKSTFDLLHDYSLIGGSPPASTPKPIQNQEVPLISLLTAEEIKNAIKIPGKAPSAAASKVPSAAASKAPPAAASKAPPAAASKAPPAAASKAPPAAASKAPSAAASKAPSAAATKAPPAAATKAPPAAATKAPPAAASKAPIAAASKAPPAAATKAPPAAATKAPPAAASEAPSAAASKAPSAAASKAPSAAATKAPLAAATKRPAAATKAPPAAASEASTSQQSRSVTKVKVRANGPTLVAVAISPTGQKKYIVAHGLGTTAYLYKQQPQKQLKQIAAAPAINPNVKTLMDEMIDTLERNQASLEGTTANISGTGNAGDSSSSDTSTAVVVQVTNAGETPTQTTVVVSSSLAEPAQTTTITVTATSSGGVQTVSQPDELESEAENSDQQ